MIGLWNSKSKFTTSFKIREYVGVSIKCSTYILGLQLLIVQVLSIQENMSVHQENPRILQSENPLNPVGKMPISEKMQGGMVGVALVLMIAIIMQYALHKATA